MVAATTSLMSVLALAIEAFTASAAAGRGAAGRMSNVGETLVLAEDSRRNFERRGTLDS